MPLLKHFLGLLVAVLFLRLDPVHKLLDLPIVLLAQLFELKRLRRCEAALPLVFCAFHHLLPLRVIVCLSAHAFAR